MELPIPPRARLYRRQRCGGGEVCRATTTTNAATEATTTAGAFEERSIMRTQVAGDTLPEGRE